MTKEEAIRILKVHKECAGEAYEGYPHLLEELKAFDMAIEALKRAEELETEEFFSRHTDDEVYR